MHSYIVEQRLLNPRPQSIDFQLDAKCIFALESCELHRIQIYDI